MYAPPWAFAAQPPVSIQAWLARPKVSTSIFDGVPMSKPYPEPIEALREAIEWYRRALAFRTGLHKGLTYKAIARTLQFLSERLGQAVDEEQLERATMQVWRCC